MFQNCQNGEQSYIHIGCSTNSLSMSCDYQCDSSIVSCVHVDRYFQLKCDSRKVCVLYIQKLFQSSPACFPVMYFLRSCIMIV